MISLTTYWIIFSICVFVISFLYIDSLIIPEIKYIDDQYVILNENYEMNYIDIREKIIQENIPHYYPIKINQSSIYPECEIKGIRYNMICDGVEEPGLVLGDGFFFNKIKQNDLVYQSCGNKSESYCVKQDDTPLFCGEYNATREFIKDSYTCNYNTPCHIEDYNTGNIEYILDYIDTHLYREHVYGIASSDCIDCDLLYDSYRCKPIQLPVFYRNFELQNKSSIEQDCGIKTAVYNVFYKDITYNPHPSVNKHIQYNIIDYENTVQYNSCERDDYPPVDDRYCIINKGQDHFCGEYQAVKTWIDQNPRDCKRLGDCFIQNNYIDYYEEIRYGVPSEYPDIFNTCKIAITGNHTNDFIINDNELFTINRLHPNTTINISNLDIDHTVNEHYMVFDFNNGRGSINVHFKPRDGQYQFVEWVDFVDKTVHLPLQQNNTLYVKYNDQCSMTEFYLDWKKYIK